MSLIIQNNNSLISTLQETNPVVISVPSAVDMSAIALAAASDAVAAAASINIRQVADTTALSALDETQWLATVTDTGATYIFTTGDFSAQITASDPRYVAPDSDPTGASGAWVRAGSVNHNWVAKEWGSSDGSLYDGPFSHDWLRTGGFGTYGLGLLQLRVNADTPAGQFDVASTVWTTHENLTGGAAFGGWTGANSPTKAQTFSGGGVTGHEINVGNRWGSNGLKADTGGTRDFTGLKVVPDPTPTNGALHYETISAITIATPGVLTRAGHGYYNGMRLRIYALTGTLPGGFTNGSQYYVVNVTTDTFELSLTYGGASIATTGAFAAGVAVLPSFPADFGLNISKSNWGHQFWTGYLNSVDSIVPGGVMMRLRGGSAAGRAVGNGIVLEGHIDTGLNLSLGTYTANNAVYLGAGHNIRWDGNGRINSSAGTMGITTGDADADGGLYANGYGVAAMLWDGTGGVPRLRFFGGGTPAVKPSITGSRGGNAALADLLTKLAGLGLLTDTTTA